MAVVKIVELIGSSTKVGKTLQRTLWQKRQRQLTTLSPFT